MPLTMTTVTGPVYLPNGATPFGGRVSFELSSWDVEEEEGLVITGPVYVPIDENGQFSVNLFTTTAGSESVTYRMFVIWEDSVLSQSYVNDIYVPVPTPHYTKKYIGSFVLSGPGPYSLSELNIVSELNNSSFDAYLEMKAFADRIDLGALDDAVEATTADRVQTGLDATAASESTAQAQAWAESATEPDGAGTKSAKTWAGEAEAARDDALTAAAALTYQRLPDPFYLAVGGQSNALGSDGGGGSDWITETGKVYVYVPSTNAWADAAGRQGLEPFNTDGSNNAGVHAALEIARTHGVTVRMVLACEGSTEIEEWTGGGYRNGVAITADRVVTDSNRQQFKKWTDAIAAASIPKFDAVLWWQSEADLDTPDAVYRSELGYLYSDLKGRGAGAVATRRFPMVVFGLYSGVKSGQQANRLRGLEKFARENQGFCGFVSTVDLAGRDDTPGPTGVINHFTSASYKIAGERAGAAVRGVWAGQSVVSDARLDEMMLPPTELLGERMGARSWDGPDITGGTTNLLLASRQMMGEVYKIAGTATINCDPTANSSLGDGGRGFEFYTLLGSDVVTIKSDNGASSRQIQMMGEAAAVAGGTGVTITGAGRGRVVYEGARWIVQYWPRTAPSQAVVEAGTSTQRRVFSPLELRQAANAAITARQGFQVIATDANATVGGAGTILHTGELTANRIINLMATGVVAGDIRRVARTGTGAFNLTVRDITVTANAKALATGQWAEFVFDGVAWNLSAAGGL